MENWIIRVFVILLIVDVVVNIKGNVKKDSAIDINLPEERLAENSKRNFVSG